MSAPTQNNKEAIIRLIEAQSDVCGRFVEVIRIDHNAGNGKFSLVFKAKDTYSKKGRESILKFFNPLLEGDLYRKQCFFREGAILKDLIGQRNILPIVQELTSITIYIGGIPFVLSFYASHLAKHSIGEYIYGQTRDLIRSVHYFRGMCKSIQRIHGKGICHRDLRPDNFLVFPSGYVCLSDFGTARYFGENAVTLLSNYAGPPGDLRYVAPESMAGIEPSDRMLCTADIYSLGAILFELFTQSVFSLNILTINEIRQLIFMFQNVPEKNRTTVFEGFIKSFASSRALPSVRSFDPTIPAAVSTEIDKLYMGMAHLDPSNRVTDFNHIFLRLNIIETILRNQKQFETWKRLKAERRRI